MKSKEEITDCVKKYIAIEWSQKKERE